MRNDIQVMYAKFGKLDSLGWICKDCMNLRTHFYGRSYHKCCVYGESNSQATDWNVGNIACGMFNRKYNGVPVIELLKHSKKQDAQIDGQVSIFGTYEVIE